MTHHRFSLNSPDSGDELMRRSNRLKLDLWYFEADGEEPAHIQADYELHGSMNVALAGDPEGPRFLRELLTAFRTTERRAEA